jgi:peptidyl-prolyl cis-trans isomerase SurA
VDSILVVVNNEVITRQEVAERLASVEKRMAAQNVQLPPRPGWCASWSSA